MRIVIVSLAIVLATVAVAHAEGESKGTIGVDPTVVLPLGDWADGAGLGFGVLGRFEYGLNADLAITGRIGYIHHLEENNVKSSEIPILAGAVYSLSGPPIYLFGGLGINRVKAEVDLGPLGDASNSETEIAMNLGAGYEIGSVDVRASVWFPSLDEIDEAFGIMVSAAIDVHEL